MTADEFVQSFAQACGVAAPTADETAQLLELAGVAAHASERVAAPICCYVAGVTGRPVSELLALARSVADAG